MKVFVATILLVASVAATPFIQSRIASGTLAKDGVAKCYATIVIEGEFGGTKTCGACLMLPENRLLTAASCVFSPGEGKASGVKVYPGIALPKAGAELKGAEVSDIFSHIDYDQNKNISLGDVAVVIFADKLKTTVNKFEGTMPMYEDRPDNFVGQSLVVCGMGSIDNYKTKPKGLMCTKLRVVPSAECAKQLPQPTTVATTTAAARKKRQTETTAAPPPPPKGVICTKNIDDKNVCGGDIGAPVFTNFSGSLTLVGVVSFYPDTRNNARCMDGHYAIITQLGVYRDFLNDPTRPQTTIAPTTVSTTAAA